MTETLDRDLELLEKKLIRKYGSNAHAAAKYAAGQFIQAGNQIRLKVGEAVAAKFVSCMAEMVNKADAELGWEAFKKEQEEGG